MKKLIHQLMALAYFPAEEIPKAYAKVLTSTSDACRMLCGKFVAYYEHQWLRKVKPEGFTICNLEHGTDNYSESYNSMLHSVIEEKPNPWKFLSKYRISTIQKSPADGRSSF